jgi:hypothetical protein
MKKLIILLLLSISANLFAVDASDSIGINPYVKWSDPYKRISFPSNGWFYSNEFDNCRFVYDYLNYYSYIDTTKQYQWYLNGENIYSDENLTFVFVSNTVVDLPDTVQVTYGDSLIRVCRYDLTLYSVSDTFYVKRIVTATFNGDTVPSIERTWLCTALNTRVGIYHGTIPLRAAKITTGITNAKTEDNEAYYDILGNKYTALNDITNTGIYIHDGKKIFIKKP